jgi:alkylation response protein AidB-like acyl-CoA dehydrogenase
LNFDYSDDQQAIKSTAREFLASRFKLEKVRELAEKGEYDDGLWDQIAELGWPGIFIDEASGGQDLGVLELAIIQEELGYTCAPTPYFSNAAAGLVVKHAGSDEQQERLLPGVASGEARGTAGVAVDGVGPLVADADSASFIVLFERGSATLFEPAAAEIEPVKTIDSTRRFFRVTPNGDGEPLDGDAGGAWQRIEIALAAELVGICQRALEMAVEYAKDRKQFDRPIGAYQGVSHRCAQMMLETESARAAMLYAGWVADNEPESLPLAASMAKAYAADAGWRVTASSLQVHGGIGFTWEHDLHWFLKRARTDGALFGSARQHRDRVAELTGLSRSAAAV